MVLQIFSVDGRIIKMDSENSEENFGLVNNVL
jgi:hypothetical protein